MWLKLYRLCQHHTCLWSSLSPTHPSFPPPWSTSKCVVAHMWAWHPCRAGWQCVGMGSGQGSARPQCCRVHFLRTIHPHPLTLSPYVQMLARGIAGALGWIRRPHRGRESRGGHGRGWPATQLPAQVSTGPHEHLLLPLLLIPSMLKAALPQLNPAVT